MQAGSCNKFKRPADPDLPWNTEKKSWADAREDHDKKILKRFTERPEFNRFQEDNQINPELLNKNK